MRRQNLFNDNQNCRCNDNSSDNSRRANDCTVINEHNCGCTICSQGPMGPMGSRGPQGVPGHRDKEDFKDLLVLPDQWDLLAACWDMRIFTH